MATVMLEHHDPLRPDSLYKMRIKDWVRFGTGWISKSWIECATRQRKYFTSSFVAV